MTVEMRKETTILATRKRNYRLQSLVTGEEGGEGWRCPIVLYVFPLLSCHLSKVLTFEV